MSRRQWEQLPQLLEVDDLIARYGLSKNEILRRCRDGRLPEPVDPGRKKKQWHPDALAEWEMNRSRSTVPTPLRGVS